MFHPATPIPSFKLAAIACAVWLLAETGCDGPLLRGPARRTTSETIQLGPRPFHLLDQLEAGALRTKLEACRKGPFRSSRFSIGHRGAPLHFPEHTLESYRAAARMGAGVLECDVTFTADRELVCRHSQCDLATTTNILETPIAERCAPFEPAVIDEASGQLLAPARRRCCTSDLTLAEFRTLEGRIERWNPRATSEEDLLSPPSEGRPLLYDLSGTLVTHRESIELFRALGVAMTPELKAPEVDMPFGGDYGQTDYARQLVDAYRRANVPPRDVFLQSFDLDDIRFWLAEAPEYGARSVWLDGGDPSTSPSTRADFERLARHGVRTIAPVLPLLIALDGEGRLVATDYARDARDAGLELIAWTLERSGRIRDGRVEGRATDFYLGSILPALHNDGDLYRVIEALHLEAGVRAIFSDWPATTTYYANCLGLD